MLFLRQPSSAVLADTYGIQRAPAGYLYGCRLHNRFN